MYREIPELQTYPETSKPLNCKRQFGIETARNPGTANLFTSKMITELQDSIVRKEHLGTATCCSSEMEWSTIESCRRAGRIYCHAIKFWKQKDCSYEFWINKQHYCSLEIMQFRDLVLPSFCSSEKPDNWQFRYQALIFLETKGLLAVTSFGSLDTTCSCRICSSKILEVPMDNH